MPTASNIRQMRVSPLGGIVALVCCVAASLAAPRGATEARASNVIAGTQPLQRGLALAQGQTRPPHAILESVADGDLSAVVHDILMLAGRTEESMSVDASEKAPTAAAIVSGGRRFIRYNPTFLAGLSREAGTYWAVVFILAHQTAHHLTGHTAAVPSDQNQKLIELEANEIAGFVLGRLGASVDDAVRVATAATDLLGRTILDAVLDPEASVDAVQRGWRRASQWQASAGAASASTGPENEATWGDSRRPVAETCEVWSQSNPVGNCGDTRR